MVSSIDLPRMELVVMQKEVLNKANTSKHRVHEVNKSLIRDSASTANARLQSPGQGKHPGALTMTTSEFQGGDSRSLGRAQGILKADGQVSAEHLG